MGLQISLAAARVNAKLTQEEVAKRLGVSKYTVGSWERGGTEPSVGRMMELCKIYNVPLDCIILPKNLTLSGK
jgi:transcriptional regulator with XRE-family HTH domain